MTCPTTTVSKWHDAIIATFKAGFANRLRQCGAYEPTLNIDGTESTAIETPALLIDLRSMAPDYATSGARQAIRCQWTAYCILSTRTLGLQVELREMASIAISIIDAPPTGTSNIRRGNRWGLGHAVDAPAKDSIDANPAEFALALHGHDAWSVDWEQIGYFSGELQNESKAL